jgi:hypothetical protein
MCGQGGRRRNNRAVGTESDAASWLLALRACVAKAEGSATSGLSGERRGELGERDQRAVSTEGGAASSRAAPQVCTAKTHGGATSGRLTW